MERVILRVRNIIKIPGRDSVAATVEVLSGEPVVGCLLHHSGATKPWQIVGFGYLPVGSQSQSLRDLLLRPHEATETLSEGTVLSEHTPILTGS